MRDNTKGQRLQTIRLFLDVMWDRQTAIVASGKLVCSFLHDAHSAARIYYGAGARFALDEMREAARRLPAETAWQKQAVETVIDDLFGLQAEVALRALQAAADEPDPLAAWAKARAMALAPAEAIAAELRAGAAPDLAMLVVATRQLREALT